MSKHKDFLQQVLNRFWKLLGYRDVCFPAQESIEGNVLVDFSFSDRLRLLLFGKIVVRIAVKDGELYARTGVLTSRMFREIKKMEGM